MLYILIVSNRKNIKENKTYPQSYQLDTNSWFIFFFSSLPPPIALPLPLSLSHICLYAHIDIFKTKLSYKYIYIIFIDYIIKI